MQQTRIQQGTPYYLRFVQRFPKIELLAKANEEEVLKLWEGLGYYSRARNLHFTAKKILSEYNGIFPRKYEEILSLKGIGEYTAAAICSIAYGDSFPVVDGNVLRVICRFKGMHEPVNSVKCKNSVKRTMARMMGTLNGGDFNEAMMEFGAIICTPAKPACEDCVFRVSCVAYNSSKVYDLPVMKPKPKLKERIFYYNIFIGERGILIDKRIEKDIWRGLYELPLIESKSKFKNDRHLFKETKKKWPFHGKLLRSSDWASQRLSHQKINSKVYFWRIDESLLEQDKMYNFVAVKDLKKIAFSKNISFFLAENAIYLNRFYIKNQNIN